MPCTNTSTVLDNLTYFCVSSVDERIIRIPEARTFTLVVGASCPCYAPNQRRRPLLLRCMFEAPRGDIVPKSTSPQAAASRVNDLLDVGVATQLKRGDTAVGPALDLTGPK